MRTVLLSSVLAASLVAGCSSSSPTDAPPSASAPPATSAPVTPEPEATPRPTPAPTPVPTLAVAKPTPGSTPDDLVSAEEASPPMAMLEAVFATLPVLAGQKVDKWDRGCEEQDLETRQEEDTWVYSCRLGTFAPGHAREVWVDVAVFADADHARSSFESGYIPPGTKLRRFVKVLAAPALGEARQMVRNGGVGCEHYIDVLEGNATIHVWFGGYGTVSPRTGKCLSWGSPPMGYVKRVYDKIADVLGTP